MKRPEFITFFGAGVAAWPLAARAQQASTAKVGLLWPGADPPVSPRMELFREGLRRSGYVEGQNVTIELRYAQAGQETTGRSRSRSGTRERRCHCYIRRWWDQDSPGSHWYYPHRLHSATTSLGPVSSAVYLGLEVIRPGSPSLVRSSAQSD